MGKSITSFDTTAVYNSAKSNFDLPNMSGCGKLTLFKRILNLFESLMKKGGEIC